MRFRFYRPADRGWTEDPVPAKANDSAGGAETDDQAGWQASTSGLAGMARLARGGAWLLIASGPLLASAALMSASGGQAEAPAAAPTASPTSDTGPAGFAQLFVAAYLEAGDGTEDVLSPYYAGPVTLSAAPGTRTAMHTVVISTDEVSAGYWAVTIAADVAARAADGELVDAGIQYYRVGVQTLGSGQDAAAEGTAADTAAGYVATSLPTQVAGPEPLAASDLAYDTSRGATSGDPVVETAASFLGAYLTGAGDLERYVSPGLEIRPVTPAPYTAVTVTSAVDDSASASDLRVPADGTPRRLLVSVDATDAHGNTFPLSYALELGARAGRWEVTGLADAPALAPDSAAERAEPSEPPAATPEPTGSASPSAGS